MNIRRFLPLFVFIILAAALWIGLGLKPREVPTVMIGRDAPTFNLPSLTGDGNGLSSAVLQAPGVKIVNVFASWCVPCRVEHPQLKTLSQMPGVTLYGIDYKDDPENARTFLAGVGNPFAAIGADRNGRVSIDWGVYGVPETFVIDQNGKIVYRHVGAIMEDDVENTFKPLLAKLQGNS